MSSPTITRNAQFSDSPDIIIMPPDEAEHDEDDGKLVANSTGPSPAHLVDHHADDHAPDTRALAQRRASRMERVAQWRNNRIRRCKSFLKKSITFLFSHVGLCCLVVLYSIMGGLIFQAIEGPNEMWQREQFTIDKARATAVRQLWNETRRLNILYKKNWTEIAQKIVEKFQSQVIVAVKDKGWTVSTTSNETQIQWTFPGSLLYAVTVITTIGYGHITPKTAWGRITTMFYALLGIPLMFLCLANIGNFFANTFRFLYKKYRDLCRKLNRRRRGQVPRARKPVGRSATSVGTRRSFKRKAGAGGGSGIQRDFHSEVALGDADSVSYRSERVETGSRSSDRERNDRERDRDTHFSSQYSPNPSRFNIELAIERHRLRRPFKSKEEKVSVPLTCSILIIFVYIMAGACAFHLLESWDMLESSYFCFITLSTIGFGDYVPGTAVDTQGDQEKLIFCALYLLFGLAIICMAFDLMQEEVRNKFRWLAKKIGVFDSEGE